MRRDATQDPDVLDTGSRVAVLCHLGWPEKTPASSASIPVHPGDGADILFFWSPHADVAITSWARSRSRRCTCTALRRHEASQDEKSLGNGIDPLVVVEKIGADALRWTCRATTAWARLLLDPQDLETTFAPGRNSPTSCGHRAVD